MTESQVRGPRIARPGPAAIGAVIQILLRPRAGNDASAWPGAQARSPLSMNQPKRNPRVRYAYGLTGALLLGGATLSLVSGLPAGAQVAQNDASRIGAIMPRANAPASFADLTAQLQPAVVSITTRQQIKAPAQSQCIQTPFGSLCPQGGEPQSHESGARGSGFIVSPDGYIVTNNHVVTMDNTGLADSISIKLADGNEYKARIVGRDRASDVAVLKIDGARPLPFVKFGDSAKARAGDWVIAIGNPFGLGGTVTAGIISSVNRPTGSGAYDHYMQTDAAINPGNSGGPMFDMAGNVIGINNWIVAPGGGNVGIGFAIPSDTARPIVEKLISGKVIERGFLGIRIQPVDEDTADALGLAHNHGELVESVEADGPATRAGIKQGDVITRVRGEEVTPDRTLSAIVAYTPPGTRIPIELIRNGQHMTLDATVTRRPSEEDLEKQHFSRESNRGGGSSAEATGQGSALVDKTLGLKVEPLTAGIARELNVAEGTRGVVVDAVDSSSDAAVKHFERGDIIIAANNQPVGTIVALEAAIHAAQAANRAAILLQVIHQGQPAQYVPVRLR